MPELSPFYHELFAALNRGLWMSVALIVPAACGGVAIGLLAGSCRACGPRWLCKLGDFYAALFRGTPLVVQLFVLYYGLPDLYMHLKEPLRTFSFSFSWQLAVKECLLRRKLRFFCLRR